jgi:hypothetical protein
LIWIRKDSAYNNSEGAEMIEYAKNEMDRKKKEFVLDRLKFLDEKNTDRVYYEHLTSSTLRLVV